MILILFIYLFIYYVGVWTLESNLVEVWENGVISPNDGFFFFK